jgi:hypothetical protein
MNHVRIRRMAKNTSEARANLLKAIKKIGGMRKTSAVVDISEAALKLWLRTGDLNKSQAIRAFKFARAAGESIEAFLVVEHEESQGGGK